MSEDEKKDESPGGSSILGGIMLIALAALAYEHSAEVRNAVRECARVGLAIGILWLFVKIFGSSASPPKKPRS